MKYVLNKLSSPYFEFTCCSEILLYQQLEHYICASCMTLGTIDDPDISSLEGLPKNFYELPLTDRIDCLLMTQCGAEFTLDKIPDEIEKACYNAIREGKKCVVVTRKQFNTFVAAGGKVSRLPNYVTHVSHRKGDSTFIMICLY